LLLALDPISPMSAYPSLSLSLALRSQARNEHGSRLMRAISLAGRFRAQTSRIHQHGISRLPITGSDSLDRVNVD